MKRVSERENEKKDRMAGGKEVERRKAKETDGDGVEGSRCVCGNRGLMNISHVMCVHMT